MYNRENLYKSEMYLYNVWMSENSGKNKGDKPDRNSREGV